MTAHNGLRIGGRSVVGALTADRDVLIDRILARLGEALPTYGRLPREMVQGELRRVCDGAIRLFCDFVRTGEIDDRTLRVVRSSAGHRADDGVPLEEVLAAYCLGIQICNDHVAANACPEDLDALLELHRRTLQALHVLTSTAAAGYAEEHQAIRDDQLSALNTLCDALLAGDAVEQTALRLGIRLPAAYWVLAVSLAPDPETATSPIAVRRQLRRVRDQLQLGVRGTVLSRMSAQGGVVLVPVGSANPGSEDWERLTDLVHDVQRAAATEVTVTAVPAVPAEVGGAASLAGELLELAESLGRGQRLYGLHDLALEYQLTRPTLARRLLSDCLAPLREEPQLLATLQEFVRLDLSRRRTAEALDVHPNTVDNRLRRVAQLTGLDVARHRDLPRITAALTALG